jgi:hypothetical protein
VNPETEKNPRASEEWRVEVVLGENGHGQSLGESLHNLQLDDEARKRLGGSVVVTRDGNRLFLYAWHEDSAREAEGVVRELMEEDGLTGEVRLMRWHPAADEWRPADQPLPESDEELTAEEQEHALAGRRAGHESGDEWAWEVVIDLPDLKRTQEFAHRLEREGLPVKRRWKYLLVGTNTEEEAVELGQRLEGETPEGAKVGIRANPKDVPHPLFVMLGSWEPGPLRDLGI